MPVVLLPENAPSTVLASYIHLDLWHLLGYVFCCFSCIMNSDGIALSTLGIGFSLSIDISLDIDHSCVVHVGFLSALVEVRIVFLRWRHLWRMQKEKD